MDDLDKELEAIQEQAYEDVRIRVSSVELGTREVVVDPIAASSAGVVLLALSDIRHSQAASLALMGMLDDDETLEEYEEYQECFARVIDDLEYLLFNYYGHEVG